MVNECAWLTKKTICPNRNPQKTKNSCTTGTVVTFQCAAMCYCCNFMTIKGVIIFNTKLVFCVIKYIT